jgi:hypothetical protein
MEDADILKGLIIGAVLLLIFTKKNEEQQLDDLRQSQIGIHGWKPLDQIQNFDDLMIGKTTFQPVVQSAVNSQSQQIVDIVPKEIELSSNDETEYKNKEIWKIARNQDGDIETIEVERNAKVS